MVGSTLRRLYGYRTNRKGEKQMKHFSDFDTSRNIADLLKRLRDQL